MLKTVIETTDGLDDAVKSLYTETDGGFILQIEGVDAHPDVANLKNAYERVKYDRDVVKTERDTLKAQVASLPDDFDADRWAKLKDGKPDEAAQLQLRQEYEAKISDLEGKLTATQEAARKSAIDRDLVQHLNAAGVTDKGLMQGAMAMLSGEVKVSEDGKPFVETDMGPLDLGERVKRWATAEGKAFVDPGKGGGAKGGSGGGAQTTAAEFAAMGDKERTELLRSDPETFKRLSGA